MIPRLSHLFVTGLAAAAMLASLPFAAPVRANETAMTTVTGQISYRQRIALPPGSMATVTVSDVSRADAPASVLAETLIPGAQVPIPFSLDVPTDEMTERGRYALRAVIHDVSGTLRWTTDSHIPVDPALEVNHLGMLMLVQVAASSTPGETSYTCGDRVITARFTPETLSLTLDGETHELRRAPSGSGARYANEDDSLSFWDRGATALLETAGVNSECLLQTAESDEAIDITGDAWRVESINSGGVVDNSQTSLEFSADGTVSGRGGCNRYSGRYTRDGDTISFAPLATTQMACTPALGDQERKFLQVLSSPVTITFDATGAMILTNESGDRLLARR